MGKVTLLHDPRGLPEFRLQTPTTDLRIPDAGLFATGMQSETSPKVMAARQALAQLWGVDLRAGSSEGAPPTVAIMGRSGVEVYDVATSNELKEAIAKEMNWYDQTQAPLEIGGRQAARFRTQREPFDTVSPSDVGTLTHTMMEGLEAMFREALERCFPGDFSSLQMHELPASTSRESANGGLFGRGPFSPGRNKEKTHLNHVLAVRTDMGDEFALQFKLTERADGFTLKFYVWRSTFDKHSLGEAIEFHGSDVRELEREFSWALQHGDISARIETSLEQLARQDRSSYRPHAASPEPGRSADRLQIFPPDSVNGRLQRELQPLADAVVTGISEGANAVALEPIHDITPRKSFYDSILNRHLRVSDGIREYLVELNAKVNKRYIKGQPEPVDGLLVQTSFSRGAYGETIAPMPLSLFADNVEDLAQQLLENKLREAGKSVGNLAREVRRGAPEQREILAEVEGRLGLESGELADAVAELDHAKSAAGEASPAGWTRFLYDFELRALQEDVAAYDARLRAAQTEVETWLGMKPGELNDRVAALVKAEAEQPDTYDHKRARAFEAELLAKPRARAQEEMAKLRAAIAGTNGEQKASALRQALDKSLLVELFRREFEVMAQQPILFQDAGLPAPG